MKGLNDSEYGGGFTRFSIVVAMDRNGAIGRNGALPWHCPADFAHFKRLTMGGIVVMGRKTYESIGKPLEGRENWVLTSGKIEGVRCFSSVDEVVQAAQGRSVWIIGGAAVYSAFLPMVEEMWITRIDRMVTDADTYFPDFDGFKKVWEQMGEWWRFERWEK